MKGFSSAILFLIILFVSPTGASAPQEKTSLVFAPPAGVHLTYSIRGMVNMNGKDLLGGDLSMTAVTDGDLQLAVKTSTHDTVHAGLTSPGINISIQLPDRTLTENLTTQNGKTLDVVFNRTGKVEDIRNPDALDRSKFMNFSIPQIIGDYFPTFPAVPVAPGDRWTGGRRMSLPFQGFELQVDLAVEYTLTQIIPSPEGPKAFISVLYTLSVSGSRKLDDAVGVFEGSGTGTGILEFLVDRGYFTEYRVDVKTDAAFVMKKGTERLLEWPFTFTVFADVMLTSSTTW